MQSPSRSSGGQHGRGGTSNQSYGRNQSPNNGSYSSHRDQRRATPTGPSRVRTPPRATANRGHSSGSVPDQGQWLQSYQDHHYKHGSPSYHGDPTPLRDNARKDPPFNPDYRDDPSGVNSREHASYHESSGHSFRGSNPNLNVEELNTNHHNNDNDYDADEAEEFLLAPCSGQGTMSPGSANNHWNNDDAAGSPSARRSNANDSGVGSLALLGKNNNHNDHHANSLPTFGNTRSNNGNVSGVASVASLGNTRRSNGNGSGAVSVASLGNSRRNNGKNNDGEPVVILRNSGRNNDNDDVSRISFGNNHRNNADADDVQSLTSNVRVNLNQDNQEGSVRTGATFVTARGVEHDVGSRAGGKVYVSDRSTVGETTSRRRSRKPPNRLDL